MGPITDEEFVTQLAEYAASHEEMIVRGDPQIAKDFEAMAKEKGYEDAGRLKKFLLSPGGFAFCDKKVREAREARARGVATLTAKERRLIDEFKELFGREPTAAERRELFAEEAKLGRRGVST